MPLIKVIRKGITPAARKVPTSTCATILPVTLDRVGAEVADGEQPTKVESLREAFEAFKPKLQFTGRAGEEETEFRADFEFNHMKDFDPENILKKQEIRDKDGKVTGYRRNDLADLKNNIDLLYRLKDRWNLPQVRRAWANPAQRKEIVEALSRLRAELEKVAAEGGTSR